MVKTGTYKGKKVKLYFPMKSTKPKKKKMVYVLNKKTGNVNVVHYGAVGYRHNYSEQAKKSFRARHKCDPVNKLDKNKPKYWACEDLWPKGPISVKGDRKKRGTVRRRIWIFF